MALVTYWGVDFSGGAAAGKKIWLAELTADLRLASLFPARDLPGSGVAREACLPALVAHVERHPDAVFGFDFPFAWFAELPGYADPAAFRAGLRARFGGKEPKRYTEVVARVPFNSFNLWNYKQTYYGVRDVLLRVDARRVPFEDPTAGRATVIEICPASTLKAMGAYWSYKGRGRDEVRGRILDRLGVDVPAGLRALAVADAEGDALDAIIAAEATARAARGGFAIADAEGAARARAEGWVYF